MITETEIAVAELKRWKERYERILDQLPVLLETLRDRALPLQAVRLDGVRVSGTREGSPLPFRDDPVDDCDDIWASLVEYVGEVAERLQDPAPAAVGASWAVQGSVRGIPAWLDADGAYKAGWTLVAWLVDRAERIHALQLTDSETHLFGLTRKLLKRYVDSPPLERPAHRRDCTVCGERAVVVDWVLGDAGEAECRACGAVYAPQGMEEQA